MSLVFSSWKKGCQHEQAIDEVRGEEGCICRGHENAVEAQGEAEVAAALLGQR